MSIARRRRASSPLAVKLSVNVTGTSTVEQATIPIEVGP